jgi:hypothetical protein
MQTRLQRALEIRDVVLPLLRINGHIFETEGSYVLGGPLSKEGVGYVTLFYKTPFIELIYAPRPRALLEAILSPHSNGERLPFALIIRNNYPRYRLLNVEWDDAQSARVVSFRRGLWEDALLRELRSTAQALHLDG